MRSFFLACVLVVYLPHVLALLPDLIWPAALCLWLWCEGHPDETRRFLGT